jgi:hypothetical protein
MNAAKSRGIAIGIEDESLDLRAGAFDHVVEYAPSRQIPKAFVAPAHAARLPARKEHASN